MLVNVGNHRKAHNPLYEWIARQGLDNVQMCVVERTSPWRAHVRECAWMRKFPRSCLLNTFIPDVREDKWAWLVRLKRWRTEATEPQETLQQRARKFVQSLRSDLRVEDKFRLICDSKKFLEPELAKQVFAKASEHIQRDTGVKIMSSLVFKIPCFTPPLKTSLSRTLKDTLLTTPQVPPAYAEYLCSILTLVSVRSKLVGDVVNSHKLNITTGRMWQILEAGQCECQVIHEQWGVPLVEGHYFTRSFSVIQPLIGTLGVECLQHHLKHATIPGWKTVGAYCAKPMRRTLCGIPGLSPMEREDLLLNCMRAIQTHVKGLRDTYPKQYSENTLKAVRRRLPQDWVCGPFDKAVSCLWGASIVLICSLYSKHFFRTPHRYSIHSTYMTTHDAHEALYTQLVADAKTHMIGTSTTLHLRGTSADYRAIWQQTVKNANSKLVTHKRRTKKRKGLDSLQDPALTTGLKRRKGAQGQHLSSSHLKLRAQTQRQSFVLRAPGCQLLVKWKSREEEGWLKAREVLTRAAHPFKKPNKLMGRVMTLFWRLVVTVLRPCELLSMKDLLHVLARWKQSCRAPRKGQKAFWLELDLVEMFPRIPRHAILPALRELVRRTQETKSTRGPIRFWVSKGRGRPADTCDIGNKCSFWELNTTDMFRFVQLDLECNTKFVCLSSILNQMAGVPIGGSASAQLACLTLVMRELELARPIPGTPHVRYRDNFVTRIIVKRSKTAPTWEEAVNRKAAQVRLAVKKITGMDVTVEQWGLELDFLEARLRPLHTCTQGTTSG